MKQKELFQKCFGANRYFYNKTIEYFKTTEKPSLKLQDIRNLFIVKETDIIKKEDEWQSEIPYDTRQLAIKDAISIYKSNLTKMKNKTINHFELSYKSKKSKKQQFWIDDGSISKDLHILKRRLKGDSKLIINKKDEKVIPRINKICDSKIFKLGKKYYLELIFKEMIKELPKTNKYCALNPGKITFQTLYDSESIVGKIGDKLANKQEERYQLISKLQSKLSTLKGRRKTRNIYNRIFLLRTKIRNSITDIHRKLVKFLVNEYDTILLPEFKTKKIIEKNNLSKETKRGLLSLRHYDFKERLKMAGDTYGKKIEIVTEEYTSKTCGSCGKLNNVGKERIYSCLSCNLVCDRDYNGARNILLKNLDLIHIQ